MHVVIKPSFPRLLNANLSDTIFPQRRSRAGRGALILYVLVLLYASLSPFIGWHKPEAFTLLSWPRHWSVFDIALNVLAYIPLGVLLALQARRDETERLESQRRAGAIAIGGACAFSALMELLQMMLPGRVSSSFDLLANGLGAAIGALGILSTAGRLAFSGAQRWRHRHFALGNGAEWGLMLLALWLFAQLNPAIPYFQAGYLNTDMPSAGKLHPYDPVFLIPHALGVALNVCGFALFLALILHPAKRILPNVLLVLMGGFVAKVSAAALLLRAPALVEWISPATLLGFVVGLVFLLVFLRLRHRWRLLAATLLVFGGGLLAKMTSLYGAVDETLRLFNWPYGHLLNFTSLTRWAHEVWPLLACIFLSVLFVRHRELP